MKITYRYLPEYGCVPVMVEEIPAPNQKKSTNIYKVLDKMIKKSYRPSKTRDRIGDFINSLCSE